MEKQHQPGDFSVPEAPPPYFPPVVSQPLGMGNSESYPMSHQPPGMPGHHPVPVGPLAPAPYQNQAVYPGQYVHPPNFQMVPDNANLIDGILARENILSFHSNQSIGCGTNSLIVQIRGSQNQLIMSTLMTTVAVPTGYVADSNVHHSINAYKSTIMFNDTTGKNMMTCKEIQNELTVTVGDRLLGVIRGAAFGICNCCGSLITVETRNGETFFEIEPKGSEFTFVRNGTTIATARKGVINGDDFGVEFAASLDSDTKAMIAAVSYNLYVLYHAHAACGCSGTLALVRCTLLIPVIMMLTFGIVMAIVFTTI